MNFSDIDATAFRLSLQVGVTATILCAAVGVPLAWWIVRARPLVGGAISTFVLLPLLLPPTAIGYYLLYGLGRESAFGRFLIDDLGISLVFTWQGASLAAAVVALPLFVRTAQAGFEQVDPDLLDVGRTLGKGRVELFLRVAVPLAWPSLVAATLIGFARAVGEFGATVIVAGNIPGSTQTVPTAIYDATQAGNSGLANALAFIFLVAGLAVLALLTLVLRRAR